MHDVRVANPPISVHGVGLFRVDGLASCAATAVVVAARFVLSATGTQLIVNFTPCKHKLKRACLAFTSVSMSTPATDVHVDPTRTAAMYEGWKGAVIYSPLYNM